MNVPFDTSIFRDYDIRGIYPQQISEKVFYLLGQALANYFKKADIAVGYDCRLSSKKLFKGLSQGIISQSLNVVNLGLISTEMHYFASGKYSFKANVIISASHNPPQYNGLKIVKRGVIPLHGSFGLPEIRRLAIKNNFVASLPKGKIIKKDIIKDWLKHALSFINTDKLKPIKVVIDAGSGMAGISWQGIKDKLPVKIIPLYFKPDGNFPYHLPDPIKEENLKDLKHAIVQNKADLGFAMDGDADRIFVLDEKGIPLSGTETCALLAEIMLKKYGRKPILYNVVVGKVVPEIVKKYGAKAIRVRVGHSFIKEKMKEEKAIFAGEHSGHFYFQENFNAESSLIAGLLILQYLSQTNLPLSLLTQKYKKNFPSGEINFRIKDITKVDKIIKNAYKQASSMDTIDGLSVFYPSFWFNLRSSKTEPLVRLNLEASNSDILKKRVSEIKEIILSSGGKQE